MKKLFLVMLIIASGKCFAATGSASDGELAVLSLIAILMLPLAVAYLFHFLKGRINDFRTKRMLNRHFSGHNGEI
jgi:hypothetical protein